MWIASDSNDSRDTDHSLASYHPYFDGLALARYDYQGDQPAVQEVGRLQPFSRFMETGVMRKFNKAQKWTQGLELGFRKRQENCVLDPLAFEVRALSRQQDYAFSICSHE